MKRSSATVVVFALFLASPCFGQLRRRPSVEVVFSIESSDILSKFGKKGEVEAHIKKIEGEIAKIVNLFTFLWPSERVIDGDDTHVVGSRGPGAFLTPEDFSDGWPSKWPTFDKETAGVFHYPDPWRDVEYDEYTLTITLKDDGKSKNGFTPKWFAFNLVKSDGAYEGARRPKVTVPYPLYESYDQIGEYTRDSITRDIVEKLRDLFDVKGHLLDYYLFSNIPLLAGKDAEVINNAPDKCAILPFQRREIRAGEFTKILFAQSHGRRLWHLVTVIILENEPRLVGECDTDDSTTVLSDLAYEGLLKKALEKVHVKDKWLDKRDQLPKSGNGTYYYSYVADYEPDPDWEYAIG